MMFIEVGVACRAVIVTNSRATSLATPTSMSVEMARRGQTRNEQRANE